MPFLDFACIFHTSLALPQFSPLHPFPDVSLCNPHRQKNKNHGIFLHSLRSKDADHGSHHWLFDAVCDGSHLPVLSEYRIRP